MSDISYEFLTKFFTDYLPFSPTPSQVEDFQSDLTLVSPYLLEASLIEVKEGTKGEILKYLPNDWRPAIFSVYNRKVAEHAQLFPVFHSFENALRSTVAVTLEQHYKHPRWWRAIYEELKRGGRAKNIAQIGGVPLARHAAFRIGTVILDIEGKQFPNGPIDAMANGYEFMHDCHLAHIRQLIEEHWAVFSPKFRPLSAADFTAKFEKVREARNAVYHHRSLSGMSDVVAAAEELLDKLNFCLKFVHGRVADCEPTKLAFSVEAEKRHRTWVV
ncbi:hypothetical protein J6524_18685 [Bradyrhizobium sp. WSM 1738]|uniref:hypothetical protein n=1 Tax=Bradyrhizobium hereditatis TaxID=2821405 RepID=UPI001CE375A9|nr:hypothetical protein [Bradyrhizobium hereditatis]MCA6116894.1 hypothetical protein [Bradyrhizobium hereditatis]